MNDIINKKFKELLQYAEENVEIGPNTYNYVTDIHALINIIVKWYEFKYPSYKIKKSLESLFNQQNKSTDYIYRKTENLANSMGYMELMFRIPKKYHPLIECWYKDKNGSLEHKYIKLNYCLRNTNNRVEKYLTFDRNDGYLEKIDDSFDIKGKSNLEGFLESVDQKEYDVEEIKKVVLIHNIDMELRKKIFSIISLKLFFSSKNLHVGYIRAKKFIEEFNKYIYDLNISDKEIRDLINNKYVYIDVADFEEEINYIEKDLYSIEEGNNLDELGLTFDSLKKLKNFKINSVEDLARLHSVYLYDEVDLGLNTRDRRIIYKRKIEEAKKRDEQFHEQLLNKIQSNNQKEINELRKTVISVSQSKEKKSLFQKILKK